VCVPVSPNLIQVRLNQIHKTVPQTLHFHWVFPDGKHQPQWAGKILQSKTGCDFCWKMTTRLWCAGCQESCRICVDRHMPHYKCLYVRHSDIVHATVCAHMAQGAASLRNTLHKVRCDELWSVVWVCCSQHMIFLEKPSMHLHNTVNIWSSCDYTHLIVVFITVCEVTRFWSFSCRI